MITAIILITIISAIFVVLNKSLQGNAEVVSFGIQRNSGYRTSPPVAVPTNSYQQQGSTAYFPSSYTTGATQVNNPATISVNFMDAYGNAQSKSFPVLLMDTIAPAQQVYQVEQAGNPYLKDLQECIGKNKIQIIMDDEWFSQHCEGSSAGCCFGGPLGLAGLLDELPSQC